MGRLAADCIAAYDACQTSLTSRAAPGPGGASWACRRDRSVATWRYMIPVSSRRHGFEPTLTIEVTYSEIVEDQLRNPVYRGLT